MAVERRCELSNELTKDYDAVTIHTFQLLGFPDFPKIKVRTQLSSPDGPPKEWAE